MRLPDDHRSPAGLPVGRCMMIKVTHIIAPGIGKGPTHGMDQSGRGLRQSLCGMRPQLRHNVTPYYGEPITCAKCARAIKRGHAYARGQ